MKTIYSICFTFALIIGFNHSTIAQKETIYNLKSNIIKVEADYVDLKIETWNKDHIQVDSKIKINLADGTENHSLKVANNADGITINSSINTEDIEQMIIVIDKDGNKTFTLASDWDDSKEMEKGRNGINIGYEIDGELTLYVPENMFMEIKTTYGDVVMDGAYLQIETCSTYGMIEAKLEDVSQMRKVALNSTYDFVDLTLDKSSDATLKLNTSYGEVFSDLPLQSNSSEKSEHHNHCSKFSEKYVLNDGSVAIDIVATYDNIYVRGN